MVKILRVLAAGDRELFDRLRLDREDIDSVLEALGAQLEHHLDRQLKALDFARRVRTPRPGSPRVGGEATTPADPDGDNPPL